VRRATKRARTPFKPRACVCGCERYLIGLCVLLLTHSRRPFMIGCCSPFRHVPEGSVIKPKCLAVVKGFDRSFSDQFSNPRHDEIPGRRSLPAGSGQTRLYRVQQTCDHTTKVGAQGANSRLGSQWRPANKTIISLAAEPAPESRFKRGTLDRLVCIKCDDNAPAPSTTGEW
jgi:hypothetical protein